MTIARAGTRSAGSMLRVGLLGAGLLGPASGLAATLGPILAKPGDDVPALVARAKAQGRPGVVLTAGVYYLQAPVRLSAADSGTPQRPFVIAGAPGARPVLSAGRPLGRLTWTPWRDGIWRARLSGPAFDSLRTATTTLVRARYPNRRDDGSVLGGVAADATAPARVKGWSDPAGGVIHALHPSRWGGIDQMILGKAADGGLMLADPVGNNRMDKPSPDKRYVENILEELDAPGEWFADFKQGWLYLKPPSGAVRPPEDLVGSRLEAAIVVTGAPGRPVHDIVIRGLEIRDTLQTFAKTTEPLLRSDWMFYRGGAVLIENARNVTLADSDIRDVGGNGVVVSGFNRGVSVRGNHIWRAGASAIAFVGRPEAVRSPLFEYHQSQPLSAIDRVAGPRSDAYPADSEARDNLIHDIGLVEKQSAGVQIQIAARILVRDNSIYRVPRAGINIGDGAFGGHRLVGNDVFATVLETSDHGAFNAWGRDRYWTPDRQEMNRRLKAEPSLAALDALAPTLIDHNRFQCDHGWDIDLDDGASNYIIQNNVLLSGGLKLREGFKRIARNNVVLNSGLRPHVWFENSGDVVEHNIFGTAHGPIGMKFWGARIDRNLLPDKSALAQAQSAGTDLHSLSGDPMFVSVKQGDYRVKPGSPALKIGFVPFPTDRFGVTSPRLRALAQAPKVPELFTNAVAAPGQTVSVLGMTLKKVESLDEQSAAGLPDKDALLIEHLEPGSIAAQADLMPGDAILAISTATGGERQATGTLADFMTAYREMQRRGRFTLTIFRNQSTLEKTVRFE